MVRSVLTARWGYQSFHLNSLSLANKFSLHLGLSIYYAEAYAIFKAISYCSGNKLDNVCIVSDSARVLSDIRNCNTQSSPHPSIIYDICNIILNSSFRTISLVWFPGHCNILNIESSDLLAKSSNIIGFNPNIPIPYSEAGFVVRDWIFGVWHREWEKNKSCSYQRLFNLRKNVDSFCENRMQDVIISRMRLLQTRLNYGLTKIGVKDNENCETCLVRQDEFHFIFDCIDTHYMRMKLQNIKNFDNSLLTNRNYAEILSDSKCVKVIAEFITKNKCTI